MICLQCKTRNPIGNKFCRECGTKLENPDGALAAEEAARAEAERREERVAALLAEALALSEQDRPQEALPLAEEAAELLPSSTSAQALLAALYEHAEQWDKAIAAMERVVALNPDSAADQAKLEQLRRGVRVLPVRPEKRPARPLPAWTPLVAAGGVAALVLGFGIAALNRPAPATGRVAVSGGPSQTATVSQTPERPVRTLVPQTATDSPAGRSDPFTSLAGGVPAATPAPAGRASAAPPRSRSMEGTSAPRRFTPPDATGAARALPPVPAASALPAPGAPPDSAGQPPAERVVVRPPIPVRPPTAADPPTGGASAGDSYIRIQVSPPRAAEPPKAASPAETDPLLRGQSLQSAGRYREAIAAYQQALRSVSGARAGDAYQGIALSQQRLGNDEAARNAYRQAIAAYEAQAASGRETGAAQRGIATCRAALEVLGNG